MTSHERAFPQFAYQILGGLYKAVLTDPDVFLLSITGVLLGARRSRLRGIGTALGAYVTLRRFDRYVDVGVQIAQLARINRQKDQLWCPGQV